VSEHTICLVARVSGHGLWQIAIASGRASYISYELKIYEPRHSSATLLKKSSGVLWLRIVHLLLFLNKRCTRVEFSLALRIDWVVVHSCITLYEKFLRDCIDCSCFYLECKRDVTYIRLRFFTSVLAVAESLILVVVDRMQRRPTHFLRDCICSCFYLELPVLSEWLSQMRPECGSGNSWICAQLEKLWPESDRSGPPPPLATCFPISPREPLAYKLFGVYKRHMN